MSPALKDLVRNILMNDPDQRFTLDQIKAHRYFTKQDFLPLSESSKLSLPIQETQKKL